MAVLNDWILATRPKTLPAGAIPVILGTSIAFFEGYINYPVAILALVCSLMIQIITNFINEIYDYKKGADTEERLGPLRVVAAGIVSPKQMKTATIMLSVIAFLLGLIIVWYSGWVILAIGVLSLMFAYFYTGGPYPLSYLGIADVFVLIFFGLVATSGTYYAISGKWSLVAFIAGFAPGLFSMNILGINNIRDIPTDTKVNKKTLAVRLGRQNAITVFTLLNTAAFTVNVLLTLIVGDILMTLPLILLPMSIKIIFKLKRLSGTELNALLADNGKLLTLHGIITSLCFILVKYIGS